MQINEIKDLYEKYVNKGLKDEISLFSFSNDIFLKGKGVFIYTKNKRILDITGGIGVLNHGHNHPKIIKSRIKYNKNFRLEVHKNILSPHVALLSKKISKFLNNHLTNTYLCNSGAESNEASIKAAFRFHEGKRKTILHSNISFHGKLITTGDISSPLKNLNFPKSIKKREFIFNSIESIKKIEFDLKRKKNDYFALIIEPYSASTATATNEKFLKYIRNFCNKNKILLIFDEIYTGWCKTGSTFYFQRYKNIYPDFLTTSKSLGGGKASIAACIMKKEIFNKVYGNIKSSSLHSTTFNGFGEECITAIEALKIIRKDNYNAKAKSLGKKINREFLELNNKFPDFRMKIKGCGGIQKIYFDLNQRISKIYDNKNFKNNYKNLFFLKKKLFEIALIDTLYFKYNIFAYHSLNSLVVSPSLVINHKEINYLFLSLKNIFKNTPENIIKDYLKRVKSYV